MLGRRLARSLGIMLLCDFSDSNVTSNGIVLANMLTAPAMLIASKWETMEGPSMEEHAAFG